jgi:hypothetical protein
MAQPVFDITETFLQQPGCPASFQITYKQIITNDHHHFVQLALLSGYDEQFKMTGMRVNNRNSHFLMVKKTTSVSLPAVLKNIDICALLCLTYCGFLAR